MKIADELLTPLTSQDEGGEEEEAEKEGEEEAEKEEGESEEEW